jgi:aspartate aminotransferase
MCISNNISDTSGQPKINIKMIIDKFSLLVLATSALFASSFPVEAAATSKASISSIWGDIPQGPPDAILGIAQNFRACEDERKVNVCVGAYRDENGQPWVLPSVRSAEEKMLEANDNKEYLPIEGDQAFVEKALKFIYGRDAPLERIAGVQTLSGTGACRIGGQFLANFYPGKPILLPVPTWGNHHKIFGECGLDIQTYRYYDRATNRLDLNGMIADLEEAPEGSIVLLHACAHNPTGCDPTSDQWKILMELIKKKGHLVFFDSAYQVS